MLNFDVFILLNNYYCYFAESKSNFDKLREC